VEEDLKEIKTKLEQEDKELSELKIEIAVMEAKQEALIKKVEGFSSGVNRGLWIIGGGFITAFVVWVTDGGLGNGP